VTARRDGEGLVTLEAPAKINLTLHVTGQRADGYHLLDSLVVFASAAADRLALRPASEMALRVSGPFSAGVPEDRRNLCWRAAELAGAVFDMHLDKRLPHAAGIGSGSSDAAAVLRGVAALSGMGLDVDAATLGADVPVCLSPRAQRMTGIGEVLAPVTLPALHAVLVNPGVEVATPSVFAGLARKDNPPMTPPGADIRTWLAAQRNDLQGPATALVPEIGEVLASLDACPGAWLARMSGSGATCFALFDSASAASAAVPTLRQAHPDWWVVASDLV